MAGITDFFGTPDVTAYKEALLFCCVSSYLFRIVLWLIPGVSLFFLVSSMFYERRNARARSEEKSPIGQILVSIVSYIFFLFIMAFVFKTWKIFGIPAENIIDEVYRFNGNISSETGLCLVGHFPEVGCCSAVSGLEELRKYLDFVYAFVVILVKFSVFLVVFYMLYAGGEEILAREMKLYRTKEIDCFQMYSKVFFFLILSLFFMIIVFYFMYRLIGFNPFGVWADTVRCAVNRVITNPYTPTFGF